MFCTNCGKTVAPDANFCGGCGSRTAPLQQQPSAGAGLVPSMQKPFTAPMPPIAPQYQQPVPQVPVQQAAPAPSAQEATELVLSVTRKLSLVKAVACHLVFKPSWVVVAHLTPALQKAETVRLQEELKAQNVGFMKRAGAQMSFWANYHTRYFEMASDAILAEDPTNQAINYGTISGVYYHCATTQYDADDTASTKQGSLNISLTNGETLKFTHKEHHNRTIQDALTALFGPRLKYKK